MTAMTLAQLSGGRFLLGLGPSGPQVIEGPAWGAVRPAAGPDAGDHRGGPFRHFSGEKITYSGTQFRSRARGGAAMRLSLAANPAIPIYIASMSPKMLESRRHGRRLAGNQLFVPEGSAAYFEHLDRGLAGSGRTRSDLDVVPGG